MSDVHSTFLYTKGHEWIEKVGERGAYRNFRIRSGAIR